jgi:coproporphyrinogen III oxidase
VYINLLKRNKDQAATDQERAWQALRRGRYVEFNLVWDRGTKFGLETDGRTESILMSMPPQAEWVYDHRVSPSSPEGRTLQMLRKDIDWLQYQ